LTHWTTVASFIVIRSGTRSQWIRRKSGVMCSRLSTLSRPYQTNGKWKNGRQPSYHITIITWRKRKQGKQIQTNSTSLSLVSLRFKEITVLYPYGTVYLINYAKTVNIFKRRLDKFWSDQNVFNCIIIKQIPIASETSVL